MVDNSFLNLSFLILMILLIDRHRLLLISFAFLVSFILVGIVNELGYFFGLWSYPHQFITAHKAFNAVDFLTVPVIITLIYQFISTWKNYLLANIIIFLPISFLVLPTFVYSITIAYINGTIYTHS